jgi:hypothetical protein
MLPMLNKLIVTVFIEVKFLRLYDRKAVNAKSIAAAAKYGAGALKIGGSAALGSAAALAGTAAAGVAGVGGILYAKHKFNKVIDQQNANSAKNFSEAKKLQEHLNKRKLETGMSLKQRQLNNK